MGDLPDLPRRDALIILAVGTLLIALIIVFFARSPAWTTSDATEVAASTDAESDGAEATLVDDPEFVPTLSTATPGE